MVLPAAAARRDRSAGAAADGASDLRMLGLEGEEHPKAHERHEAMSFAAGWGAALDQPATLAEGGRRLD